MGLSAPLALAQEPELTNQSEQPLWTTQPTRIDPSRQHFERIPAKKVVRDSRNWLVVPQRIRVIDSTSFTAGETTYRLANIRPVKSKRLCQAIEGGRWACGRPGRW